MLLTAFICSTVFFGSGLAAATHRIAPFYQLVNFPNDDPDLNTFILFRVLDTGAAKQRWNIDLQYYFYSSSSFHGGDYTAMMSAEAGVQSKFKDAPVIAMLDQRSGSKILFFAPDKTGSKKAEVKTVIPKDFHISKIFAYDENQIIISNFETSDLRLLGIDGSMKPFLKNSGQLFDENKLIRNIYRIEGHGGKRFLFLVSPSYESSTRVMFYVERVGESIKVLQKVVLSIDQRLNLGLKHGLAGSDIPEIGPAIIEAIHADRVWVSYHAYGYGRWNGVDRMALLELKLDEPGGNSAGPLLNAKVLTKAHPLPNGRLQNILEAVLDITPSGDALLWHGSLTASKNWRDLLSVASGTATVANIAANSLISFNDITSALSAAKINHDFEESDFEVRHPDFFFPYRGKGDLFYSTTSAQVGEPSAVKKFFSTVLATLRTEVGKENFTYLVLQKPTLQLWEVAPKAVKAVKLLESSSLKGEQFALVDSADAASKVLYFISEGTLWRLSASEKEQKIFDKVRCLEPGFSNTAFALTDDGRVLQLSSAFGQEADGGAGFAELKGVEDASNAVAVRFDAKSGQLYLLNENHIVTQYLLSNSDTGLVATFDREWALPEAFHEIPLQSMVLSSRSVWALDLAKKRIYRFDREGQQPLQSIDLSGRLQRSEVWGDEIQLQAERDGMLLVRVGTNLLGLSETKGPSLSLKELADGLYGSVLRRSGVPVDYRKQMTAIQACAMALLPSFIK